MHGCMRVVSDRVAQVVEPFDSQVQIPLVFVCVCLFMLPFTTVVANKGL